jgi:hypothetical protein
VSARPIRPGELRGEDRAHVAWIARFGVATVGDLARRFTISERRVRASLGRALERGLLQRAGALVAEPEILVATRAGLRAAGMAGMGLCRATPRAEGHLRAVSAAAVWLELSHGERFEVWSERELRMREGAAGRERPRRLARPYVHHRGGAYKRPDLLIVPRSAAEGPPVAVEVELTRKSIAHLEAICRAWRHCPGLAGVLYLAAPEVVGPLRAAVGRADAGHRIAVLELAPADVPALRRRSFYRPQPVPRVLGLSPMAGPAPELTRAGRAPAMARAEAEPAASRGVRGTDRAETGETPLSATAKGVVERGDVHVPFRAAPRAGARARGAAVCTMIEAVRLAGRFGIVSADTLASRFEVGEAQLRRLLDACVRDGLVHVAMILRGEPLLVWPTRLGLQRAELPHLAPPTINYRSAATLSARARVAALLEREQSCVVLSERELRGARAAEEGRLPAPAARLLEGDCNEARLPALLLVPGSGGLPAAVTVDIEPPSAARLAGALAPWTSSRLTGPALVFVPRCACGRVARALRGAGPAGDRVAVRPLPRSRRLEGPR